MRLSKVWTLILCSCAVTFAAEVTAVENNQIKLTYDASAVTVVPGHKATLVIEIDPKANMHLYAPGASGYIPIEWKIAESKAWNALPTVYPPSHMLNLPAIKETVPVFSDHIKLTRDVTLAPGADLDAALTADRMLTVTGSFEYQACDDKLCYFPKSIPLTWTFKVGQPEPPSAPAKTQRKSR